MTKPAIEKMIAESVEKQKGSSIPHEKRQLNPHLEIPEEFLAMMRSGNFTLSYSSFSAFMKSPHSFMLYKTGKKETTKSMTKGSVFHNLTLEPENFSKSYVVQEVKTPSGNLHKFALKILNGEDKVEAYKSLYSIKGKSDAKIQSEAEANCNKVKDYLGFLKTVGEREVIGMAAFTNAKMMSEAVLANPVAKVLLKAKGECEKSTKWSLGGFEWRGYIDKQIQEAMLMSMLDLKQVPDANPVFIQRKVKYEWNKQGALYSLSEEGYWNKPYYLIAVDPNFQVSVTNISTNTRQAGLNSLEYYFQKFRACIFQEDWLASYEYFSKMSDGIYTV